MGYEKSDNITLEGNCLVICSTLYKLHTMGPMTKSNILQYTRPYIKNVEAKTPFDNDCEILVLRSFIEELQLTRIRNYGE